MKAWLNILKGLDLVAVHDRETAECIHIAQSIADAREWAAAHGYTITKTMCR